MLLVGSKKKKEAAKYSLLFVQLIQYCISRLEIMERRIVFTHIRFNCRQCKRNRAKYFEGFSGFFFGVMGQNAI